MATIVLPLMEMTINCKTIINERHKQDLQKTFSNIV